LVTLNPKKSVCPPWKGGTTKKRPGVSKAKLAKKLHRLIKGQKSDIFQVRGVKKNKKPTAHQSHERKKKKKSPIETG